MNRFEDLGEKIQYEPQQKIYFPSLNPGNCFRITNPSGSSMTFMVEKFDPNTGLWAICLAHDDLPHLETAKVVFNSGTVERGKAVSFKIPSPKNPALDQKYLIDIVGELGIGAKVNEEKPQGKVAKVMDATSKAGKDFLKRIMDGDL